MPTRQPSVHPVSSLECSLFEWGPRQTGYVVYDKGTNSPAVFTMTGMICNSDFDGRDGMLGLWVQPLRIVSSDNLKALLHGLGTATPTDGLSNIMFEFPFTPIAQVLRGPNSINVSA